jgi:hypothetical protein
MEMVSLKKEGVNISSTSAKIKLTSNAGKTLDKKLLMTMTVKDLKAMCAKLFKIEMMKQKLTYHQSECQPYVLDEDLRQLSFYSISDGGEIKVEVK